MKMRWDDLRVFLALTRSSGMREAAKSLGVNASTLSRRLNALEESLGQPLFQRDPEGLTLTALGHAMLERAASVEHAHLDLAEMQLSPSSIASSRPPPMRHGSSRTPRCVMCPACPPYGITCSIRCPCSPTREPSPHVERLLWAICAHPPT